MVEINSQSTKCPGTIRADGDSTLDIRYTLKFECFGAGALTSFKIPRTDVDVTGLSTDYDGSIGANIDILKDIRQHGIRASVYSPAQH